MNIQLCQVIWKGQEEEREPVSGKRRMEKKLYEDI